MLDKNKSKLCVICLNVNRKGNVKLLSINGQSLGTWNVNTDIYLVNGIQCRIVKIFFKDYTVISVNKSKLLWMRPNPNPIQILFHQRGDADEIGLTKWTCFAPSQLINQITSISLPIKLHRIWNPNAGIDNFDCKWNSGKKDPSILGFDLDLIWLQQTLTLIFILK